LFAGEQRNTAAETIHNAANVDNVQPQVPAARPVSGGIEGSVIYDNGPIITHPGGGAGGNDASALQTALTLTIYGFGQQGLSTVDNRVADDFTIADPDGWTIDGLCFYGYQTLSSTTSTFTAVKWWIYDGDPSGGGTVVASDSATLVNGRLVTSWAGIYRTLDTDIGTATTRPVMLNDCAVSPALVLEAGTYWIVTQAWGTLASGPWCPPVTILGLTGKPGANGKQYQGSAGMIWVNLVDGVYPQDIPFLVKGTINTGGDPCEDFTNFVTRCTNDGMLQARVVLSMNTKHAGEMVEFTVDEDTYTATIVTNGVSSRAQISLAGFTGSHTISVTDPAGCFDPRPADCPATAKAIAEWEADDARWEAETRQFNAQAAPVATKLMGNYPNPFNPSTSINYALSEDGFVSLKIYNTLGEEVVTLVNEYQVAGTRSAVWNGRNEAGVSVASGIYIYRLTAGSVVLSEKMMFMK
jgi:hypothetical protein